MTRLDSTAGILLAASERLHERYKSGRENDVAALGEEFGKLRPTYVE